MKKQIISVAMLLSLTGCATIFTGSRQNVKIYSIPSGAGIFLNGDSLGVTPGQVRLKKGFNDKILVLKKSGYHPQQFNVKTSFNPVTILNILLGGIIGTGIDAITGAMMHYSFDGYEATLVPNISASK